MARNKVNNLAHAGKVRNSTPRVPARRVKKKIPRIRNHSHFVARVVSGRFAGQPGSLGAIKATGAAGMAKASKSGTIVRSVNINDKQHIEERNDT
nr:30S ribosomal protein S30e [Candidatus Sigynarchaeum springense]MDO8118361.1 30S ribosomal protein S30e [Candidatus Sigynarchaeota archaeon]